MKKKRKMMRTGAGTTAHHRALQAFLQTGLSYLYIITLSEHSKVHEKSHFTFLIA